MTPREYARLKAAIEVRRAHLARTNPRSFIPHTPTAKQRLFLDLDCLEAFYGGAAAGGKSDALLMGALEHVHVPGYSALVLRRTYADLALPGAIMDRSHDWLQGTGAKWNGQDKRWTFPSGASLTFGYLDTEKDKFRYASAEFQYIAFDELTQFPEAWYRFLLSRLRRAGGLQVPLRARAAGNPGGIGHAWVKRRFVDAATRAERGFVPANLADNPHVDAAAYRKSLAQLDEATRRQLEEGIWIADSGGLVYRYDPSRNVIARAPKLDTYLLGIDYGFTDETAFTVLGWRNNDPCVYVVESYKRAGMTPSAAAEEVQSLAERYAFVQMVADIGGLGKGYAEEARDRFLLPIEPAEKNNKRGYQSLFNGDLERGRIRVVAEGTKQLVDEWLELPWTEDHAKEADGFANHCADSCLYAWRAASAYHEQEPAAPPTDAELVRIEEAEIVQKLEAEAEKEARGEWWDVA